MSEGAPTASDDWSPAGRARPALRSRRHHRLLLLPRLYGALGAARPWVTERDGGARAQREPGEREGERERERERERENGRLGGEKHRIDGREDVRDERMKED